MAKKIKIIDKTEGLNDLLGPRIFYQFFTSGKTVDNIICFIRKEKSTRTFDLNQIEKALHSFDLNSVFVKNKDFNLIFLAKHMAGGNYVLVRVTYSRAKNIFTIEGICYNNDILPDVLVAYAFD